MSRTKKFLPISEYYDARAIKLPGSSKSFARWSIPDFSMNENEKQFLKKAIKAKTQEYQTGSAYRTILSSSQAADVAVDLLGRRGIYSMQLLTAVRESLRHIGYYSSSANGDVVTFSNIALSEFLNSRKNWTYGEFLDENWDDIFDRAQRFETNETPELIRSYSLRKKNILSIRPNAPLVVRESLERLTRNEIASIFNGNHPSLISHVANKDVPRLLAAALSNVTAGRVDKTTTPTQLMNLLQRGLNKSLDNDSESHRDHLAIVRKFGEELFFLRERISTRQLSFTDDVLYAGSLEKFVQFMLDNASKFTSYEYFFCVRALVDPAQWARGASRLDVLEFYLKALEMGKEDALELFREIGEMGALSDDAPPSVTVWNESLANGGLKDLVSMEFTLAILGARSGKPKRDLVQMRKLF